MSSRQTLTSLDQFLPCYAQWDAIGTHARELQTIIRGMGLESDIFYELSHPTTSHVSKPLSAFTKFNNPSAGIVNHFSTGSVINHVVAGCNNFTVTSYHNITPASFFQQVGDGAAALSCHMGVLQLPVVARRTNYLWYDSQYNSKDFLPHYKGPSEVLPILRRLNTKTRQALATGRPGRKTLLFVGRVVSSKALHDLMFLLKLLNRVFPNTFRIVAVGDRASAYASQMLPEVARNLGLELSTLPPESPLQKFLDTDQFSDVILAGRISDEELSDAYRSAWAFATMSDHEGYCVPLVEALAFGLPVFANGVTAIPETLGAAGQLVDKLDWDTAVAAVAHLHTSTEAYDDARRRSSDEFSRRYDFDTCVKAHERAILAVMQASASTTRN